MGCGISISTIPFHRSNLKLKYFIFLIKFKISYKILRFAFIKRKLIDELMSFLQKLEAIEKLLGDLELIWFIYFLKKGTHSFFIMRWNRLRDKKLAFIMNNFDNKKNTRMIICYNYYLFFIIIRNLFMVD